MKRRRIIDVDDLASQRLGWCRQGGRSSGEARRESGKRPLVEHALKHSRETRCYSRDTASKIARYLGVSARYVRMVAAEMDKIKAEVN
jgi:hypothetical protein